jgi:hypothetical protein
VAAASTFGDVIWSPSSLCSAWSAASSRAASTSVGVEKRHASGIARSTRRGATLKKVAALGWMRADGQGKT